METTCSRDLGNWAGDLFSYNSRNLFGLQSHGKSGLTTSPSGPVPGSPSSDTNSGVVL